MTISNKVTVDRTWYFSPEVRAELRSMIEGYRLSQPPGTEFTSDYLNHVLRTVWYKYLEDTNGQDEPR